MRPPSHNPPFFVCAEDAEASAGIFSADIRLASRDRARVSLGVDPSEAEASLEDTDRNRDCNQREYYRRDSGDSENYHMALNNEPLGTDNAAGLVVTHAKALWVVARASFRALEDGDQERNQTRHNNLSDGQFPNVRRIEEYKRKNGEQRAMKRKRSVSGIQ